MAKKISLLLAAVAVLAFAVPAMASASTGLTSPKGTLVPVGTLITGTNTGTVVVNSTKLGQLKCGVVKLEGKVTKNSASEGVAATGNGFGTSSSCEAPGGGALTIDEINLTSISSTASESGTGKASFTFKATLPGPQTCNFAATNAPGTYTSETNVLNLKEAPLTVSGTNCGTAANLTGSFALTKTSGGAAVYIM